MTSKKLKLESREETVEGQETDRGDWDLLPQEVLNMIFNHLPVADLFSCSVMSKNWKKASRDVLKRSRECYARMENFRQDVRSLSDMIASTDLIQMINGLHIRIRPKTNSRKAARPSSSWRQGFRCSYFENILQSKETRRRLDKAKQKLQGVLCGQWKFLNLDMGYYWDWQKVLSIDDALLLRELLSSTSRSIQKLVVGQDQDCDFMSCCGKAFSKLKVLQIQDANTVEESFMEQFVLEFAPNLEEISGAKLPVTCDSLVNPSFMLKRMKSIMVAPNNVISEAGLTEGFRSASGLRRLGLKLYHFSTSEDVSILSSMVLNSLNTLEELRMRPLEFDKLFKTSDEIKFPNLRRLSLFLNWRMPIEYEISALRGMNLPKLCPNLEHMELISEDECRGNYEVEEEIPFEGPYEVAQSDVPLQIKMMFRGGLYRQEYLKFLNQIYRNIYKVAVLKWMPYENFQINSILSGLHSLEYLEINVSRLSCYPPDVAIAAFLYGVDIEEAKFLLRGLGRSNGELNLHIVPTHPSLFNAKNLKELRITGEGNYSGAFVNHSWFIQVTENLPVRHVRNVVVTFEGMEGLFEELKGLRVLKTLLRAEVNEH